MVPSELGLKTVPLVKPSDKGGNVVLLDNHDYIIMCQNILDNKDWYNRLSTQCIDQYNSDFYMFFDQAYNNGVILKDLRDFIRTKHPKIATFYSLPKIHKNQIPPPE